MAFYVNQLWCTVKTGAFFRWNQERVFTDIDPSENYEKIGVARLFSSFPHRILFQAVSGQFYPGKGYLFKNVIAKGGIRGKTPANICAYRRKFRGIPQNILHSSYPWNFLRFLIGEFFINIFHI